MLEELANPVELVQLNCLTRGVKVVCLMLPLELDLVDLVDCERHVLVLFGCKAVRAPRIATLSPNQFLHRLPEMLLLGLCWIAEFKSLVTVILKLLMAFLPLC